MQKANDCHIRNKSVKLVIREDDLELYMFVIVLKTKLIKG